MSRYMRVTPHYGFTLRGAQYAQFSLGMWTTLMNSVYEDFVGRGEDFFLNGITGLEVV